MHNYKELNVWKKAVELSVAVYALCSKFSKEEKYGLKSQMQRCSVSIPSNIAEGAGRNSKKDFTPFLAIATGSSYELETQLLIAENIGITNDEKIKAINSLLIEIMKMIYVLSKSLDSKN